MRASLVVIEILFYTAIALFLVYLIAEIVYPLFTNGKVKPGWLFFSKYIEKQRAKDAAKKIKEEVINDVDDEVRTEIKTEIREDVKRKMKEEIKKEINPTIMDVSNESNENPNNGESSN